MVFIGMDDTDIVGTRGTGQLARTIAAELANGAGRYQVVGITRHQLLVDPRVPCTKNNSSAVIHVREDGPLDLEELFGKVRAMMCADLIEGSDPGLCVAREVPGAVVEFGRRAKEMLVTLAEARSLAASHGIRLEGLGGDQSGMIGALSAVGLAATGGDGRYIVVGCCRELTGLQPVQALLDSGVASVETLDGQSVTEGLVRTDKLRPARRMARPVAFVEWAGEHWEPLKLD
ncbi:MAG TPA: ABC transporter substrate-binding protein [Anaerolineae bacterium]|nr:ABC transporter substrate-binding protein [Anaerolineae bacterium]